MFLRSIISLALAGALALGAIAGFTWLKQHEEKKQDKVVQVMMSEDFPMSGPTSLKDLGTPYLAPKSFDTMHEAAVYAAQMSYDASDKYEYGGVILKDDKGKFWITTPYTDEFEDSMMINHVSKYAGYTPAGEFHTHPCLPYSHMPDYFSMPDIANIIYYDEPGYVTNLCNGHVYEFDPAIDKPDNIYVLQIHRKMTHGRQVGQIAITKQPIEKESPPTFGDLVIEMTDGRADE